MTDIDPAAPVLVTGATGYIASWIVRYLLEDGYTVRGTVRDAKRKTKHLAELSDRYPGKLTLHTANLLEDGSFTDAMAGCQLVLHTASPFLLGKVRDPQEQLVRPALDGTRNVLESVNATGSVKRVVLTSSVAALFGDNQDMQGRTQVLETDWNTTSSVDHQPYPYSKTVAEREAWAMNAAQSRWDLVTIHPGLVLGPSLTTASASGSHTTMRHFVDYSMAAGTAALELGAVDVRDVARMHISAGFTPNASGRYIANAETVSMLQLGKVLRRKFGRAYPFPYVELPKFMIKLGAPVAGLTAKYVDRNVGWPLRFDNSRSKAELGTQYRPVADSVVEHFQQMIDDGLVRGPRRR